MHKDEDKQITDHQEMYLKVIYGLIQENKVARVKDIADRLGVTKSSVSGALKSLADKELIDYDPYSYVTLTKKGDTVASELLNKYKVLTDFLVNVLSVPEDVAEENACRMEHVVDNFVMERLVQFLRFFERGGLTFKPKKSSRKASTAKSAKV